MADIATPLKGPPELAARRAELDVSPPPADPPADVEPYTIDVWGDGTAGRRCHRCGRYAGPYGTEETARRQADWHEVACSKTAGQG